MVRERWGDDTENKNACFARFMEANWTEMFGEMNNADIEAELRNLLEPTD